MVNIKGKNPPQFGYVVENGTDNHTVSAEELEKLWKQKKYQRFHIQLVWMRMGKKGRLYVLRLIVCVCYQLGIDDT